MKHKLKEWAKRYIPAEIVCTTTMLILAWLTFIITKNRIITAYVGSLSEAVSYYIFMAARDVHYSRKAHKENNLEYGIKSFLKNIRNLIIEFGPSEFLDSFVIRPFLMWSLPIIFNNFPLGILAAKIAADIIFYVPTIIMYELRKKHLID